MPKSYSSLFHVSLVTSKNVVARSSNLVVLWCVLSFGQQETGKTSSNANSGSGRNTSHRSFFHFSLVLLFFSFNTCQMKLFCQPTFGVGPQNILAPKLKGRLERKSQVSKNREQAKHPKLIHHVLLLCRSHPIGRGHRLLRTCNRFGVRSPLLPSHLEFVSNISIRLVQ
jgi:hypothetical protein